MRTNWTLRTSEVLQTDRAGLAGSAEVCGAYTGAVCSYRDARAPTMSVTYDTPDLEFAAVVTETTPARLRILMYNFHDTPTRIGLRPWRLLPGVYVLDTGEPVPGEKPCQKRYTWTGSIEIEHRHRGEPVWIDVPPRKEWVVDLRLRREIEQPAPLPDLAIASRDVRREGARVVVSVHNIGGGKAAAFDVIVESPDQGGWARAGATHVEGLPAIQDFEPVVREIEIEMKADEGKGPIRVVVDPEEQVEEVYELNNRVQVGG
jgi:hypothetical protein